MRWPRGDSHIQTFSVEGESYVGLTYFHVTLPTSSLERSIFRENGAGSESENFGSTLSKSFTIEFFLGLVSNILC